MDMDDSQNSYRPLTADGSKFKLAVYEMRKRPFRTATLCLGLLCVLLLAGVIGQGVHFRKAEHHQQNNYNTLTKQRDDLQTNLNAVLKERNEQQNTQAHLQSSNSDLQREKDRVSAEINALKKRNDALANERNTLKDSEKQLQADKSALTKERDQLKANQERLQTNNDALTKAKDLLQTTYNSVIKERNELKTSYSSAIKERDVLQNKYNNVTRAREQLQISYDALLVDLGKIQDIHNTTKSEKEKLKSDTEYQQTFMKFCTAAVGVLRSSYNDLIGERDLLRVSYDNVTTDRDQLKSTYENCTLERDGLQARQNNLTAERDHLQQEVERLNATNAGKICPSGYWRFQQSCYFMSMGRDSWSESRKDCQNRGADLAIINSTEEMKFLDSLQSADSSSWIGLTDMGIEGHWVWVDRTPLTTRFWDEGQPNNHQGTQDCAELVWKKQTRRGYWNDDKCENKNNWICEIALP